ncbi:Uncharacterised protein [Mycobacteroides abscessus subsp. abscessus]|nr:Uncharacterised protein [Mycobacteroides abscessus subsp. abscessus]
MISQCPLARTATRAAAEAVTFIIGKTDTKEAADGAVRAGSRGWLAGGRSRWLLAAKSPSIHTPAHMPC